MKPSNHTIRNIRALELLDVPGSVRLRVEVELGGGLKAQSTASLSLTGSDSAQDIAGYVERVVARALRNVDVCDQERVDASLLMLNGNERDMLLAGITRATSVACAKLGAIINGISNFEYIARLLSARKKLNGAHQPFTLPLPIISTFYGRQVGDTTLDFKEYCLLPVRRFGFRRSLSLREELRRLHTVVAKLTKLLDQKQLGSSLSRHGGFTSALDSTIQAFDVQLEAIREAGLRPGDDVVLGINAGASALFDDRMGEYRFQAEQSFLSREQMVELFLTWLETYPIGYLQDPLDQDDWTGLSELQLALDHRKHVVQRSDLMIGIEEALSGDIRRVQHASRVGAASCVVVPWSLMQTVTEAVNLVLVASEQRMEVVLSRGLIDGGGDMLADLAVGLGVDAVKFGSLVSADSIQLYNRLLEIEQQELGTRN